MAIASAQQNPAGPVSVTHELFHAILQAVNIQLLSVRITSLTDGVFYSELVLSNGCTVSSRPVDGIALAIRTGATIEAAAEILYGAAVEVADED